MRGNWRHRWCWLLLAVAVLLLLETAGLACPTCKDSLAENDPARAGMVRGYFWSIIFMMSMPFLILAGLSSYFYLEVRRARRLQAEQAASSRAAVGQPVA